MSTACDELDSVKCESVWCTVKLCKSTSVYIGVCYRRPNASNSEFDAFCSVIQQVSNRHCITVGDFNFQDINWNTYDTSSLGAVFLDKIWTVVCISMSCSPHMVIMCWI